MKLTKKNTIISTLIFVFTFSAIYYWLIKDIPDDVANRFIPWYTIPLSIILLFPVLLYLIDTENTISVKRNHVLLSFTIILLGLFLMGVIASITGYSIGEGLKNASNAIT